MDDLAKQIETNLKVTPTVSNPEKYGLLWDGSHMGKFQWDTFVVSWVTALKRTATSKPSSHYASVRIGDRIIPVILKPNFQGYPDQAIIDELKPFFGVKKMYTHRLTLDKVTVKIDKKGDWYDDQGRINATPQPRESEYFMFLARTDDDGNIQREPQLSKYPPGITGKKQKEAWIPFVPELARIFLFREVIRASDSSQVNILVIQDGVLSIDEVRFKKLTETNRTLSRENYALVYGPNAVQKRKEILFEWLNLNGGKDWNQLMVEIHRVVDSIDPNYRWILEMISITMNAIIAEK